MCSDYLSKGNFTKKKKKRRDKIYIRNLFVKQSTYSENSNKENIVENIVSNKDLKLGSKTIFNAFFFLQ